MVGDGTAHRRRRDAAIATVPFVAALAAVLLGVVRPSPVALVGGVIAAVLAELLAARHASAVRAAWARPAVQVVATGGAVLAVGAGAFLVGGSGGAAIVSFAAGGLAGYLLLLAASSLSERE